MKFVNQVRGFTLIELLVVIAIIGVLSSVVLASMTGARQRGRDAKRVTEVKTIQLALEMYFDSCREYPAALAATSTNGCASGTDFGDFMSSIPVDPMNTGNFVYTYRTNGSPYSQYVLRATLEDSSNKVLTNDVDGTVLTLACNDTSSPYYYCVQS
jgi:type II secretion system protein G